MSLDYTTPKSIPTMNYIALELIADKAPLGDVQQNDIGTVLYQSSNFLLQVQYDQLLKFETRRTDINLLEPKVAKEFDALKQFINQYLNTKY
jgi:hypothetical protein